ncbi:MAG: DUF1573 domain-containing protein [Bacteroidales bacterium]
MLVMISGCKDNGKIPADVVKNPISADQSDQTVLPQMVFEREMYDFGKLVEGEVVTYSFKFTNKGGSDLLISQVHTSCGCTATEYPEEPIPPGKSGKIKVTFDSSGRIGVQRKRITAVTNGQPNETSVYIKAQVIKP